MAKLRPPVKWHGGKFYLCDWIIGHFPPHRIYLEPFGGGASVLLNKEPADVEAYNDLDGRIVRLFRVLRERGAELADRLRLTPYAQAEFDAAAADGRPSGAGEVDEARRDFVRWRQSFGGRGGSWSCTTRRARGGMAGDVNAWWTAIDGLPQVVTRLRRVELLCMPAVDAIRKFDDAEALIYCDPPYVHGTRASTSVYGHEMTDDDHVDLADALRGCRSKVVLSGYPSELYRKLYRDWRCVTRDIANHAAGGGQKRRETEGLWMNF
jgi:DNA adenine methylase